MKKWTLCLMIGCSSFANAEIVKNAKGELIELKASRPFNGVTNSSSQKNKILKNADSVNVNVKDGYDKPIQINMTVLDEDNSNSKVTLSQVEPKLDSIGSSVKQSLKNKKSFVPHIAVARFKGNKLTVILEYTIENTHGATRIRELAQVTDTYANLSARIKIATKDGGDFNAAMAGVHQVALTTNSNLETTAGLFTRLNTVAKDMNMSQQQALDLTKTVTQAIQLGGGSAQASDAAVTQFIQAMQGGVLRGEEFNSIMENGYGLAEALARGLNVTTGELRKMAENGELGAERVLKALESQKGSINDLYNQMPLTIGNALQKISISWQILIGEMDQANGASATVAQWLSVLADNMKLLQPILDDIGNGFVWVGDQLKKIEPETIYALKEAASQAYDLIKNMFNTLGGLGESVIGAINATGSAFGPLVDSFIYGNKEVSGLTKIFDGLRLVLAVISDGFTGLNISFKLVLGGLQFIEAGLLSVKAKIVSIISPDWAAQIQAQSDALFSQAEKNGADAKKLALESKVATIAVIQDLKKTEEERNADRIADNQKTLNNLKAQEEKNRADYKAISDERIKLDQQLVEARKSGNQTAIDAALAGIAKLDQREKEYQAESKKNIDAGLIAAKEYAEAAIKANNGVMDGKMQLDLMDKGYIVTMDQAGKMAVAVGKSMQQAAEDTAKKEEAIKNAKAEVKKIDEEYMEFLSQSAVRRAQLSKQIEDAKKSGDLNAVNSAQQAIKQIDADEAEFNVKRLDRINKLNLANSGASTESTKVYSQASLAAKQFGVDLDGTLNRVSKSFATSGGELGELQKKLQAAGVTGKQSGEVIYLAWQNWLEKAKSQAEIDAAKAQLIEFGKTGVLSAKQVEMGMRYLDEVNGKLPKNISEVEKAYKLLGITSREEANKMADFQVKAFNVMTSSGTASAENIKQALINMADKIYASGDAAKIAWYESKLAINGLGSAVDDTGKKVVKTHDEMDRAAAKHASTVSNSVTSAYREMGAVAREEAKHSIEAWNDALTKKTEAETKERDTRNANAVFSGSAQYSKAYIFDKLKGIGYDEANASRYADQLFAKGMSLDSREASIYKTSNGDIGSVVMMHYLNQAHENGRTYSENAAKSIEGEILRLTNDYMKKLQQTDGSAKNIETASSSGRKVDYSFNFGGKQVKLQGDASDEPNLNSFFAELERYKKGM